MILDTITDKIRDLRASDGNQPNVNTAERVLSAVAGAYLTYKSLDHVKDHPLIALQELLAGGLLLYRGASGFCPLYSLINKDSTDSAAVHITESFIVDRPRAEVYSFWRRLENLPRFMKHLASVEEHDAKRSHWRANIPGEILKLTWNAEITREDENNYIGWQSVEGSMVANAGKVTFHDALNGTGTELTVDISYFPPAGSLGQGVARLLNPIFSEMVANDVRNFAHYVEGEEYKTYDHEAKAWSPAALINSIKGE